MLHEGDIVSQTTILPSDDSIKHLYRTIAKYNNLTKTVTGFHMSESLGNYDSNNCLSNPFDFRQVSDLTVIEKFPYTAELEVLIVRQRTSEDDARRILGYIEMYWRTRKQLTYPPIYIVHIPLYMIPTAKVYS